MLVEILKKYTWGQRCKSRPNLIVFHVVVYKQKMWLQNKKTICLLNVNMVSIYYLALCIWGLHKLYQCISTAFPLKSYVIASHILSITNWLCAFHAVEWTVPVTHCKFLAGSLLNVCHVSQLFILSSC